MVVALATIGVSCAVMSKRETARVVEPMLAASSASASPARTSASETQRLEPLYDRTVHGRVVHVTRGHVSGASSPVHGALARTRTGQWVSVALLTPIDTLDQVDDLEAPELLSGTAFDGSCGVSLFMYVFAAENAQSCAQAFDPSRDLRGHRETIDLSKLDADQSLFADAIDFEERGVPMRLVRVFGVVDDLCFAMHATMKAETDRRLSLVSRLVGDLSVRVRPR